MKESEAKNKSCPHLFSAMSIASSIAVSNAASEKVIENIMMKGCCHGSGCVMWEQDVREEHVIQKEKPLGEGWIENGNGFKDQVTTQKWVKFIALDSGDCGLKTKESNCSYPG